MKEINLLVVETARNKRSVNGIRMVRIIKPRNKKAKRDVACFPGSGSVCDEFLP